MKTAILSNSNFMRFLRVGLGFFIIVQSVIVKDWIMGVLGIIFTLMPVFNIGCCGIGNCARVPFKGVIADTKDIAFEKVD